MSRDLFPKYQLYLSFTGGPTLLFIEQKLGSPCAQALYCSVDPSLYYPEKQRPRWDLAYLGTYASDRQSAVQRLLINVAEKHLHLRFAVAGPQYPENIRWPENIDRNSHLPASEHRRFYNSQKFTLNVTRRDMIRAGYSPSVRLFEAAACGVPILTDMWPGLDTILKPGREILPVRTSRDVTSYLRMADEERLTIGERGRCRVLRYHTAAVRAEQLETYVRATLESRASSKRQRVAIKASPTAALL
jgi:spore maturation protein CgeB